MGLLDRAVDRLKAEEAESKSEPRRVAPDRATPKPSTRSEVVFEPSADRALRQAAAAQPNPRDAMDEWVEPPLEDHIDDEEADQRQVHVARDGRVAVDLPGLARLGYAVPGFPRENALLDEHRRIKRALLFNAAIEQAEDEPRLASNLILITSALAGEGKTFVATNLALILSLERDRQAMLMDADVIRRGASHLLGLEGLPGLLDYLAGDYDDIAEVLVRPEGIDNLQFLPAGTPQENVNELLSSERMKDLMEELSLADRDRLVVIDSPPLLMTSETGLLTHYAGQIAMVVRADTTPRYTVDLALASIPPERFSGLILNDAVRGAAVDGYSEYYEE
ncbi:MAG: chromosome partitioning ATPase [Gammaproteobacteria bacterium]|nr:chromosome partitioning ATPase [Gammaproteobacteria bacterium]